MGSSVFVPATAQGLILVGKYTSGVAAATWTVSSSFGLSITKKYFFITQIAATAGTGELSLYVNNDTTATNYYSQYLRSDNATVSAARGNNALIAKTNVAAEVKYLSGYLMFDATGIPVIISTNACVAAPSSMTQGTTSWAKTAAVASITQIDFSLSASTIVQGSTFTLFEVKEA